MFVHSSKVISRPTIPSTSRIITRSCGVEYFCIGGNCESLLRKDQELMASPQEGAIEAQAAKFADEFAALTRRPPAHALVPC
jgi:hypothetical protein